MKRLLVLLFVTFGVACNAEDKAWTTFNKWDNWPQFKVPSSFTQDEKSFQGEGYKWTAIYNHPDGAFSVYASPYGYVSEFGRAEYGFQSPRDLLLAHELKAGAKVERKKGYEVFTQETPTGTAVWFLMDKAEWGNCYDSLHFSYPKGEGKKYATTIEEIVKSFKPSFARAEKSTDQGDSVQPATAVGSETEGSEKPEPNPKPESEACSQ